MTGLEAYQKYLAMQFHFTRDSYDYFKTHGKHTRIKTDAFEKRNDSWTFKKLAEHKDLEGYYLSHFVNVKQAKVSAWTFTDEVYHEWLGRQNSLSYILHKNIEELDPDFNSNFVMGENNMLPEAFRLVMSGLLSIESLVIISGLTGGRIFSHWKKHEKEDILFKNFSMRCRKYSPFLKYNESKCRNILRESFS